MSGDGVESRNLIPEDACADALPALISPDCAVHPGGADLRHGLSIYGHDRGLLDEPSFTPALGTTSSNLSTTGTLISHWMPESCHSSPSASGIPVHLF